VTPPKRHPGRPEKGNDARTVTRAVKVSRNELADLGTAAALLDVTVSELLRSAGLERARLVLSVAQKK
jgi:hypothetical protein